MAQKSLKRNVMMNVIRTISTMIFPLITFPYTSRILGPEGTGKISFATSFVSYFVLLASIGIPMYGIREIARVRDDKENLIRTTQELFILHIIVSVIVFFIFLGLIFVNGKLYEEKTLFFIVSFSIILTTLGMEWLYQGLEEYSYITIRSIIFSTISAISIFIFIHHKEDYIISGAIGVCASLGSSILNFYNARKIIFAKRQQKWNLKRHIKPLMKVFLMNFIISIYIQLDTVMLGFMSSAKNVGYYSSALKLTKILLGLVTSLGVVLLPRLSYYIANGFRNEFDNLLKKSLNIVLLLCVPIVAALMMLNHEIILLFAGNQYLPATPCVVITAPIILFIGLTNIFGIQILYPLGKDNLVTLSVSIGAVLSVVFNLILIPHFEHIGAAVATLISESSVFLIQLIIISKMYKISFQLRNIIQYLVATFAMILVILAIQYSVSLIWLRLLIVVPLGIIVYFGLLLLMQETFIIEISNKLKNRFIHV
jgi:O-antigen/teichoic acid export membrane protein